MSVGGRGVGGVEHVGLQQHARRRGRGAGGPAAKVSRTTAIALAIRACSSASCSGVAVVLPMPGPRLQAVVAADDVDHRRSRRPARRSCDVLREAGGRLRGDLRRVLPQRGSRAVEEHRPVVRQPLERVVGAVVGAVAVGPLVVARGVDQRVDEPVEVACGSSSSTRRRSGSSRS